jgi:phosphate-selective porin
MFRYQLHLEDGSDAGEATYAPMIHPGDEIHLGADQRFRVLDVVPFEEEDSPLVGLLQVETV